MADPRHSGPAASRRRRSLPSHEARMTTEFSEMSRRQPLRIAAYGSIIAHAAFSSTLHGSTPALPRPSARIDERRRRYHRYPARLSFDNDLLHIAAVGHVHHHVAAVYRFTGNDSRLRTSDLTWDYVSQPAWLVQSVPHTSHRRHVPSRRSLTIGRSRAGCQHQRLGPRAGGRPRCTRCGSPSRRAPAGRRACPSASARSAVSGRPATPRPGP
jgi:hypothetical protein